MYQKQLEKIEKDSTTIDYIEIDMIHVGNLKLCCKAVIDYINGNRDDLSKHVTIKYYE